MVDHSETIRALAQITEAGRFERLATENSGIRKTPVALRARTTSSFFMAFSPLRRTVRDFEAKLWPEILREIAP